MNKETKVWLITGASKGIGKAILQCALKNGDCVVATVRDVKAIEVSEELLDRLMVFKLDVSWLNQKIYEEMVTKAIEKFGKIDILVNNAGFGAITNFEETREETIKQIFEVNLFGMMRVTRAVLPVIRKQQKGHIINIASAAGYGAGPVVYHTSKFAVTGFSTSLAFEVEPFGIKVTNVAPGLFRTGFYDQGVWKTEVDQHVCDYDAIRWQTEFVENARQHQQMGDPDKLAALLLEVVNSSCPPLHLPVGEDAVDTMEQYCQKINTDIDLWREKAKKTSY